jgi:hypothetical protein
MSTNKTAFALEEDEWDFLCEMLRVAECDLQFSAAKLERKFPHAKFTETLRQYREHAESLRAQIEGR